MFRAFSLGLTLFMLTAPAPALAQYYKYVDEKGTLVFTDDLTRVPENKREKVQSFGGRPASSSAASRAKTERPGEEELNRLLKEYFRERYEARDSCPAETDAQVGESIVNAWNTMARAMVWGKLEKALTHFSVFTRDEYRRRLSEHSRNHLRSTFGSIEYLEVDELTEGKAECSAMRREGGKYYSYPVRFVKDPDCIWRIYGY